MGTGGDKNWVIPCLCFGGVLVFEKTLRVLGFGFFFFLESNFFFLLREGLGLVSPFPHFFKKRYWLGFHSLFGV